MLHGGVLDARLAIRSVELRELADLSVVGATGFTDVPAGVGRAISNTEALNLIGAWESRTPGGG
jgi:hypothetical protein